MRIDGVESDRVAPLEVGTDGVAPLEVGTDGVAPLEAGTGSVRTGGGVSDEGWTDARNSPDGPVKPGHRERQRRDGWGERLDEGNW